MFGHLYANDIHVNLHCIASNDTAAVLMMSPLWVSWKPGFLLTVWGSIHQKNNLSDLEFDNSLRSLTYLPSLLISHVLSFPVVRDLGQVGVTLDQELTLTPHIHHLCRDSNYQLRQLRVAVRSLRLDYSSTGLLQLTLCCPPSWAVTVPRPGPAL